MIVGTLSPMGGGSSVAWVAAISSRTSEEPVRSPPPTSAMGSSGSDGGTGTLMLRTPGGGVELLYPENGAGVKLSLGAGSIPVPVIIDPPSIGITPESSESRYVPSAATTCVSIGLRCRPAGESEAPEIPFGMRLGYTLPVDVRNHSLF